MGRKSRIKPLAFSVEPRCHGPCGLQRKITIFRSSPKVWCNACIRALRGGHGLAQALENPFEPVPEAFKHVLGRVAVELGGLGVAEDALDQRA